MNRSRLQPTCCHAPHTPTPLNLTSGLITRRSGFVLSLCQKSYIHARSRVLSSSLVAQGSIDYVRRALHLNNGNEAATVELPNGSEVSVTASFGVAVKGGLERAEQLVASADEALYEAKRNGKNRVVTVDSQPEAAATHTV